MQIYYWDFEDKVLVQSPHIMQKGNSFNTLTLTLNIDDDTLGEWCQFLLIVSLAILLVKIFWQANPKYIIFSVRQLWLWCDKKRLLLVETVEEFLSDNRRHLGNALWVKEATWIKRCKKLTKLNIRFLSKNITNFYLQHFFGCSCLIFTTEKKNDFGAENLTKITANVK